MPDLSGRGTSPGILPPMKHGPACVEGLADCDWPSCYLPACATCGRDVPEYPLFFAEAGGAASGPYCDPCAEKRREATHA